MKKELRKIGCEYLRASMKFPRFNNPHEGFAVIKEELDELWDAIKANSSKEILEGEAKQVGAMALRFLIDCCSVEYEDSADIRKQCLNCVDRKFKIENGYCKNCARNYR